MKAVLHDCNVNTTSLRLFQENTQAFSTNQPRAVCQHTVDIPSLLVSGCWLLRLQGRAGQGYPAKKISTFTDENASLCDPPHPLGLGPGDPTGCQLAARQQGYLPQPSLMEPSPFPTLRFQAWQRPPGTNILPKV